MSETDERMEGLPPSGTESGWKPQRASVGILVGVALLVLPAVAAYTGLEVAKSWLIASGVLGIAVLTIVPTRQKLLVTYHEFKAWRRHQQFDCWMRVANQLLEIQEYEQAAHWYHRLVEEYPSSLEAQYAYANCLEEAGAFGRASETYERAHQIASGGEGGMLASAVKCSLEADQTDRAVELFIKLADHDRSFATDLLGRPEYCRLLEEDPIRERYAEEEDQGTTTPYT